MTKPYKTLISNVSEGGENTSLTCSSIAPDGSLSASLVEQDANGTLKTNLTEDANGTTSIDITADFLENGAVKHLTGHATQMSNGDVMRAIKDGSIVKNDAGGQDAVDMANRAKSACNIVGLNKFHLRHMPHSP